MAHLRLLCASGSGLISSYLQASQMSVDLVMLGAFSLEEVLAESLALAERCSCLSQGIEAAIRAGLAEGICVWLTAEEDVQGSYPCLHSFRELAGQAAVWQAAAHWCRPKPASVSPFLDTCTLASASELV